MSFEEYLRSAAVASGAIDFRLRLRADCTDEDTAMTFYIHPLGKDGKTADFRVNGHVVEMEPAVPEINAHFVPDGEAA
jgi:hypothetical protein